MSQSTKAALLFALLLICGAGFVLTQQSRDRLPPPAPRDLFAAVNQQLAALRASDFQTAYRHAATGVQQRFTLPQFEKLVRRSFPEVAEARRVEFGAVHVQGGSALVEVFFFSATGSVRAFLYSLPNEGDAWKIDSVEEVTRSQRGDRLTGTYA